MLRRVNIISQSFLYASINYEKSFNPYFTSCHPHLFFQLTQPHLHLDQDVQKHRLSMVVVHDQRFLTQPGHLEDQPAEDFLPLPIGTVFLSDGPKGLSEVQARMGEVQGCAH